MWAKKKKTTMATEYGWDRLDKCIFCPWIGCVRCSVERTPESPLQECSAQWEGETQFRVNIEASVCEGGSVYILCLPTSGAEVHFARAVAS